MHIQNVPETKCPKGTNEAHTELKMTEWNTTVYISASSQRSIAAQQNIVLADGSLCSRLCRSRVAAKILVFCNFAKFLRNN